MSKRGRNLGGHTIRRANPLGGTPMPDRRPKKIKKSEARERFEKLYSEADRNTVFQIEAERRALRRIDFTGGDQVSLGSKSSGWPEYKEVLRTKLLFLKKAKFFHANEAASALNRMGFKTGSGQTWTPRLINLAKMVLFGWDPTKRQMQNNIGPRRK
jgi:hypothetical protein